MASDNLALAERIRAHLTAWIIIAFAWLIAPATIQPDTKLSLVTSPWQYLSRSLSAWNDHAALGELQNQAYGYLFPMGSVFGLGQIIGLPEWAIQRVWWSLLLLVGYWGTHRLATRLFGFSSDLAIVVALVYIVSPRVLTVLAPISIEAWPASVAPWLILAAAPLVVPDNSPRARLRSAALTAVLVASLGGVNATASGAVLTLPFLWLITAPKGMGKTRAIFVWTVGAVVGALWWLAPLFVLGRYAYPFLDYIETSGITTAVTSVPNVLRGTSHWIAYILDSEGHPVWQAGWVQAQYPAAIIAGSIVAAAGVSGVILLRLKSGRTHASTFFILSLIAGVIAIAVGYGGVVSSPVSPYVREALNGFAAPLRNVHKFDPLVRLPIAVGVAYCFKRLRQAERRRATILRLGLIGALVIAPTSIWVGRVGTANPVAEIPAAWDEVAAVIDAEAEINGGATLVLPNARDAAMQWGTVSDEPLTALAQTGVIHRSAAPLGHPGAVRLLDRFNALLASGAAEPELVAVAERLGVKRIIVRSDVDESVRIISAEKASATLAATPGFTGPREFGPSIELWHLTDPRGSDAELITRVNSAKINGLPEDLFALLKHDLIESRQPVEFSERSAAVLSDSRRWRVFNSGLPPELGVGSTLTRADADPQRIGARPLPPLADRSDYVVREWSGITTFEASSSGADPFGRGLLGPGAGLVAAIDGDESTVWWSDDETDSHISMAWKSPVQLGTLRVKTAVGAGLYPVPHLTAVLTDDVGSISRIKASTDENGEAVWQFGETNVLKLEIRFPAAPVPVIRGIRELTSDRHEWSGVLRIPQAWAPDEQSLLLGTRPVGIDKAQRSRASFTREPEGSTGERWILESEGRGVVTPSLFVRARPGPALDAVLDGQIRVHSSHRASSDPAHRPGALLDGDDATTWIIPEKEPQAVIEVRLPKPVKIGRVGPVDGASAIKVKAYGRVHQLPAEGGVVDEVADRFTISLVRTWADVGSGPWHVPDLAVEGLRRFTGHPMEGCQAASTAIDGAIFEWAVPDDPTKLLSGASVLLVPCGSSAPLTVEAGTTEVSVKTAEWLTFESLALAPSVARPENSEILPLDFSSSSSTRHELELSTTEESLLALHYGFNEGWEARTESGVKLEPVEVDGWRQGFIVPAAFTGGLIIEFGPQRAHIAGLGMGALGVLLAAIFLVLTWREEVRLVNDSTDAPARRQENRGLSVGVPLGVGALLGGVFGLMAGLLAVLVPRRMLSAAIVAALVIAGAGMSAFGVVDKAAVGSIGGQILGIFAVTVLARAAFVSEPPAERGAPLQTTTDSQRHK